MLFWEGSPTCRCGVRSGTAHYAQALGASSCEEDASQKSTRFLVQTGSLPYIDRGASKYSSPFSRPPPRSTQNFRKLALYCLTFSREADLLKRVHLLVHFSALMSGFREFRVSGLGFWVQASGVEA